MRIAISLIIAFLGTLALAANQVNIFIGLSGLSILIASTAIKTEKK